MPLGSLVSADLALGGDHRQIFAIGRHNAVTVPELHVLRAVHGADAVTNVRAVGARDIDYVREKQRLMIRYDPALVDQLYPGMVPNLPLILEGHEPDGAMDPMLEMKTLQQQKVEEQHRKEREAEQRAAGVIVQTAPESPFAETPAKTGRGKST